MLSLVSEQYYFYYHWPTLALRLPIEKLFIHTKQLQLFPGRCVLLGKSQNSPLLKYRSIKKILILYFHFGYKNICLILNIQLVSLTHPNRKQLFQVAHL